MTLLIPVAWVQRGCQVARCSCTECVHCLPNYQKWLLMGATRAEGFLLEACWCSGTGRVYWTRCSNWLSCGFHPRVLCSSFWCCWRPALMKVSGFSASGWTSMNITKPENPGSGFLWSVGGDAVPTRETVAGLLDAHSSPDPPGSWSCRCPVCTQATVFQHYVCWKKSRYPLDLSVMLPSSAGCAPTT